MLKGLIELKTMMMLKNVLISFCNNKDTKNKNNV